MPNFFLLSVLMLAGIPGGAYCSFSSWLPRIHPHNMNAGAMRIPTHKTQERMDKTFNKQLSK